MLPQQLPPPQLPSVTSLPTFQPVQPMPSSMVVESQGSLPPQPSPLIQEINSLRELLLASPNDTVLLERLRKLLMMRAREDPAFGQQMEAALARRQVR
jgi:hypothetical protein